MSNKIALVTGGNKGIGLEICRQLGQQGYTVLVGARNEKRGQEAVSQLEEEGIKAQFLQIDMTDSSTFAPAAAYIEENFGHLDALVNNAGVGLDWDKNVGNVPMDAVRQTFEINYFGQIELTQHLIPLLKKSQAGRIVNHSSILGSIGIRHMPEHSWIKNIKSVAYNSSKAALNSFTVHLAEHLEDNNIKVNAAHPGSVKTDMNPAGDLDIPTGAKTAVTLATLPDDGPTGGFFHLGQPLPW
ncbi:MAG TPA: SDR family oxidoreductase [Anaerolineae bacterium]|nr:SDR family oxidoreductase [Anaerolineae bacterium]